MSVKVYRNRRRELWSVCKSGKVTERVPELVLSDCKFVVQPGGHKRFLSTGVRNVHAYIQGEVSGLAFDLAGAVKVMYRIEQGVFTGFGDVTPLLRASKVKFFPDGSIWAEL